MALLQRFFGPGDRPQPGYVYGECRLLEKVAEGSHSWLFRGEHSDTHEAVAVKILTDEGCQVADKLTRKLKKEWEGERTVKLEHRNVVRALACGRQHGRYFLVMEYLPGGNLANLLANHSPTIEGKRIEIMRQAARGLEYVHSRGIIHRDICPRNIMLSAYGVATLIDLGVSALKADRLRDTGKRTGRPAYMAPEFIRSNHFDERTDLYAFGVSLYEVVTGRRPFHLSENTREAITRALNMGIPRPREVRPSVSLRLEGIILRALAQRPDVRYPSATVLLNDLADVSESDL